MSVQVASYANANMDVVSSTSKGSNEYITRDMCIWGPFTHPSAKYSDDVCSQP